MAPPQMDKPSEFRIEVLCKNSDVLQAAVIRYQKLTFPDEFVPCYNPNLPKIQRLEVTVKEDYEPLKIDNNEAYTLTVTAPQSSIYAYTVWGALRGLETFSQIVHQSEDGMESGKPMLSKRIIFPINITTTNGI
ncbi:predicted protein [Nematostella vectensis]|uniref:Beta-hexosaminidase eukaryotic type N-terminal domain-containing protein n=1 Tax=Nematostella vectensis TaxID=45351 RepID=A7T4N3_NEMVE|nr:predicted protein [Nematostella vectensis]|eukprot:XP_001621179.1 hypothetical protein NEMVEDRAFT_v1g222283 [Nematostella vectensis]